LAGSFYHRKIEEDEPERHLGEVYTEYRSKTPFLLPRFRKVIKGTLKNT